MSTTLQLLLAHNGSCITVVTIVSQLSPRINLVRAAHHHHLLLNSVVPSSRLQGLLTTSSERLCYDSKLKHVGKDSDAGKDWRQEKNRTTEDEMVGWYHWLNGHAWVMDRKAWRAAVCGVAKRRTRLTDWTDWLTGYRGFNYHHDVLKYILSEYLPIYPQM